MVEKGKLIKLVLAALAGGALAAMTGCGNTDGGDAGKANFDGTSFVSSDGTTGTIQLLLVDDQMRVGDSAGFHVVVNDSNGTPVQGIQIACDTEKGVALIEPASGFELTDSFGQMSGKVGCALPGSYQVGCRLPVGTNKRVLKTVRCSGPVPNGFTGFPGAGGGTLGTGTGTGDSGETDNGGVNRILAVEPFENGGTTLSVDVVQGVCGTPPDLTAEPFTDSYLKISVQNTTVKSVNFFKYTYRISGGVNGFTTSREIPLTDAGDAAPNQTTEYTAPFLKANGGAKFFLDSPTAISAVLGVKSVTVTLFGTDSEGNDVSLTYRLSVNFGNYDKCG